MFESDLGGGEEDFGMESAREINTSNLPVFLLESRRSKGLSGGGHCWGFNVGGCICGDDGFCGVLCNGDVRTGEEEDEEDEIEWELGALAS
ncbi:hypothetical protein Syun_031159 [Stephania yunnanensis]|uniref:Uncharacterized protein n=1 Tax=Stephania yunnanensis TaxID=152371 RepID=A0AAP0E063_9MAGN